VKIAIASGKGGTGKTTIATNLALSLDNVQLLDCDVEEPNSQLFLNIELEVLEEVSIMVPEIDLDKCTYCGECSAFCQYNALAVVPQKVLLFPDLCHGCGGCTLVCPERAISEIPKTVGVIKGGSRIGLEYMQGLLNVGEMLAIPVLKALKKRIDPNKISIMDAPPGTGCPPIETMEAADFCILVTEPTPFGLHDLKLAVDVVRKLEIPFGVIINRDGVGDDGVERYCVSEEIPILMRIPENRKIAFLYSKGIPFIREMPQWRERFIKLYNELEAGKWTNVAGNKIPGEQEQGEGG